MSNMVHTRCGCLPRRMLLKLDRGTFARSTTKKKNRLTLDANHTRLTIACGGGSPVFLAIP